VQDLDEPADLIEEGEELILDVESEPSPQIVLEAPERVDIPIPEMDDAEAEAAEEPFPEFVEELPTEDMESIGEIDLHHEGATPFESSETKSSCWRPPKKRRSRNRRSRKPDVGTRGRRGLRIAGIPPSRRVRAGDGRRSAAPEPETLEIAEAGTPELEEAAETGSGCGRPLVEDLEPAEPKTSEGVPDRIKDEVRSVSEILGQASGIPAGGLK
jgi:hypothetical protein